MFECDTADPATLAAQVAKLKQRFELGRVVLVGDRGMITAARIEQDLKPAGLDWITALRAPAIQALAAEGGPFAAVAVRPAGSGGDHLARLSGRALGGLPRSRRRIGTCELSARLFLPGSGLGGGRSADRAAA